MLARHAVRDTQATSACAMRLRLLSLWLSWSRRFHVSSSFRSFRNMAPLDGAELKLFENVKRLWPQELGLDTWYLVVVSSFFSCSTKTSQRSSVLFTLHCSFLLVTTFQSEPDSCDVHQLLTWMACLQVNAFPQNSWPNSCFVYPWWHWHT